VSGIFLTIMLTICKSHGLSYFGVLCVLQLT
jgi:hypothetical protein